MFNWLKKKETRSDDEVLADFISGLSPLSGKVVSKKEALSIPVVAQSVNWISSVVASLPIKMYRKTEKGYIEVYDDYRLPLLNDYSGNCMTANDLKRQIISDLLLDGNGYAYISKRGNKITKLSYVPTTKLTYTESVNSIDKILNVWVDGKPVQDYNVFRVVNNTKNGISGIGFVSDCQDLLGTILSSLKYEHTSISSGVRRGFLKSKTKLDSEKLSELKQAWRKLTSPEQSDVLVLNAGIEFEDASSTATESQLSQNKTINIQQVLSYFGLPTNFLEGANSDSYLTAVRIAVLPIVSQLTTALNNYLLLESEKGTLKFEIDTRAVTEINTKERYEVYANGISNGVLTVDEVRSREQLPVLDLPFIKMSLADVLYNTNTGEIFVPNTNSTIKEGNVDPNNNDTDLENNEN